MTTSWNAEIAEVVEKPRDTTAESKLTSGFDDGQIGVLSSTADGNVIGDQPGNPSDWVREILAGPNGFGSH